MPLLLASLPPHPPPPPPPCINLFPSPSQITILIIFCISYPGSPMYLQSCLFWLKFKVLWDSGAAQAPFVSSNSNNTVILYIY